MPSTKSILAELKKASNPRTLKTYINHGAPPSKTYGVKIADLKPIAKKNRSHGPRGQKTQNAQMLEPLTG